MSLHANYKKIEVKFIENLAIVFNSIILKISTTFSNMINAGKQRFTVMLIPHSEKKIFNFRISVFSLIVVVFLFGCMLTSFVIFTTQFKGISGLLKMRSTTLEEKETNLEIIRDQIAELKSVSRVFEASLAKTLGTLGVNTTSGTAGISADRDFAVELGSEGIILSELEDLRNLSDFLKNSVESFDEISGLLSGREALLEELPTMWPLKGVRGRATAYFGPAINPFTKKWYLHKGIDLAWSRGTPIVSTASGKIVEKSYEPNGYGNLLLIRHKYGFFTKYAHMDKIYVKEGETVTQGQVIGTVGNTGLSTGPHLHYEVRIGSQVVDPERYLNIKNKPDKK